MSFRYRAICGTNLMCTLTPLLAGLEGTVLFFHPTRQISTFACFFFQRNLHLEALCQESNIRHRYRWSGSSTGLAPCTAIRIPP